MKKNSRYDHAFLIERLGAHGTMPKKVVWSIELPKPRSGG